MSYLITLGSREGDLILDPFAGSGTTCIAAISKNRDFIGIEIDPEYHEIAIGKLKDCFQKTD
jgi:site-specific DNA-methyltransferase (adenine-specific)